MKTLSSVLLCAIVGLAATETNSTEEEKRLKEKWVAKIVPRQTPPGSSTNDTVTTEGICRLNYTAPGGRADFSIEMKSMTVCCPADVTPVLEGATSNCLRYEAECKRLKCSANLWHVETMDGCLSCCQCQPFEPYCRKEIEDCNRLTCDHGIEKTVGPEGCERCSCKAENPCDPELITCLDNERCISVSDSSSSKPEIALYAECRAVIKPGACPSDDKLSDKITCEHACSDDADCGGAAKCCTRGCKMCLTPAASA